LICEELICEEIIMHIVQKIFSAEARHRQSTPRIQGSFVKSI